MRGVDEVDIYKEGDDGAFKAMWPPCGCHVRGRACEAPSPPSLRGAGPDCLAELARPGLSRELASFPGTVLRACEHPVWGIRCEQCHRKQGVIGIHYSKQNIIGGYQKQNPTENRHK